MICQQFTGINGIGFYASETFAEAGNSVFLYTSFLMPFFFCVSFLLKLISNPFISLHFFGTYFLIELSKTAGASLAKIGTIAYACIQV